MKILKSCGSSSILDLRIKRCQRLKRLSAFSSSCVGVSCGAETGMERNLSMVKYFLRRPTRFCLNRTGPGESIFIIIDTISMGSARIIIANPDSRIREIREIPPHTLSCRTVAVHIFRTITFFSTTKISKLAISYIGFIDLTIKKRIKKCNF